MTNAKSPTALKSKKTTRNSGIELLKIFAIMMIVLFHVSQTLRSENVPAPYQGCVLDLFSATTNIQHFILIIFNHFGALGNTIFFVCSAWFLLDSSKYNKKKWFFMLAEVWTVSVVIMAIVFAIRKGDLPLSMVAKSFLPTTLCNNWYITCYLLFYPIHPFLNTIINKMSRKVLFRTALALSVLYCGISFLREGTFFASYLIFWVTIYFVIAYVKKYMTEFSASIKMNALLLAVAIIGFLGLLIATDIVALRTSHFHGQMLRWSVNNNPFLIAAAIALLNIMRNLEFKNAVINYISSLSLLIYIIHENIILRRYYRPAMLNYVYQNFGYDYIVLWVLLIALAIFVLALICSVVYDKTARILVKKISSILYEKIRSIYLKAEATLLKLK